MRAFLFKDGKATPIECPNPWADTEGKAFGEFEWLEHLQNLMGYEFGSSIDGNDSLQLFTAVRKEDSRYPHPYAVFLSRQHMDSDHGVWYFFEDDLALSEFLQRIDSLLVFSRQIDAENSERDDRANYERWLQKQGHDVAYLKMQRQHERFDKDIFGEHHDDNSPSARMASALEGIARGMNTLDLYIGAPLIQIAEAVESSAAKEIPVDTQVAIEDVASGLQALAKSADTIANVGGFSKVAEDAREKTAELQAQAQDNRKAARTLRKANAALQEKPDVKARMRKKQAELEAAAK